MEIEEELIYALSQAQPKLNEIKFRWHNTVTSPIASIIPSDAPREVTWRRYNSYNPFNAFNGHIYNGPDVGRPRTPSTPSTPVTSIVPRNAKRENKNESIGKILRLWTPDPSSLRSLLWWFIRVGIPDISRPLMVERWEGDGMVVQSMRVLYEHMFEIVKMEVMQKEPCELDTKGVCKCPLCRI
jgi:hypothetical protein